MYHDLQLLLFAAITIALLHTLSGPDHYLPFIAISKAKKWSIQKTVLWTLICGCGHVWSSVLLAMAGAAIGWSLSSVKWMESIRGSFAGWGLFIFGCLYAIWGMIRARRMQRHKHFDVDEDGSVYVYQHKHGEAVMPGNRHPVTPWVLFIIFVLGPCEPMIPLLYLPAARASWWTMGMMISVYTFFTLAAMVIMVISGYYGLRFLKLDRMEKYMHVLGGCTLACCGAGIVFLNW